MHAFASNVFSQNGEDGILRELLRRLGDHCDGHACEFGAWDGKHLSNTFALVRDAGYSAVYIEADDAKVKELRRTAEDFERITCLRAEVREDNLGALLATTHLPIHFDVLSIDVDGPDYQIWRGLTRYRPKLVVIEIESSLRPGLEQIHARGRPGSSFTSMLALARSKMYTFVCHTGNMLFVADEYAHLLDCPEDPNTEFQTGWL